MKKYIIALIILISICILTIFILDNNNKKQIEENKEKSFIYYELVNRK